MSGCLASVTTALCQILKPGDKDVGGGVRRKLRSYRKPKIRPMNYRARLPVMFPVAFPEKNRKRGKMGENGGKRGEMGENGRVQEELGGIVGNRGKSGATGPRRPGMVWVGAQGAYYPFNHLL